MHLPSQTRPHLIRLGLLAAFWVFLAALFATQLVFAGSFAWPVAFRLAFRDWLPWVIWSPLVLWLAQKYPLEAGVWRFSLLVHALVCLLVVLGSETLANFIDPRPFPPGDRLGFRADVGGPLRMDRSANELPFDVGDVLWGWPEENESLPNWRPRWGDAVPPQFGRRGPLGRANFNVPVYCFVVSISHALRYFQRSRERERRAIELEASLAQAKLRALRMQLQPHFLFNTLNAISTLVHRSPVAADEMIGNLSELLRLAMDDSDQQEITLSRELDFLDRYLEIQLVRFGDRLRVEKAIEPNLGSALVPPMILQPLVENAMRHGIEPHPTEGIVRIAAARQGDRLILSISDSGGGQRPAMPLPSRGGIGLANTRGRLEAMYGAQGRFHLDTGPLGGLAVTLEIPYHITHLAAPPVAGKGIA